MEEERARQEAAAKKAEEEAGKEGKGGEQQSTSQDATMTENVGAVSSEAENKTNDITVRFLFFFFFSLKVVFFS